MLARRGWHPLGVGRVQFLRPFLVRAAAIAHLLVKRDDMSALVAVAVDLVVLEAPEQRRDGAENRHDGADRKPEPERAPLVAADDACGEPAAEADEDIARVLHGRTRLEHPDRPDDRENREY